jgi:hypothetical protein
MREGGADAAGWNADLRIQSGSPIAPRIASVCARLAADMGFSTFRERGSTADRQVIEIFPSEAIWALGILGCYGSASSQAVRAYKSKTARVLSRADALDQARLPLMGFQRLLGNSGAPGLLLQSAQAWVEQIAEHCCAIAAVPGNPQQVEKGKGFDDPLESGLAFFTAVCFALGELHAWGTGEDGTIVGPGRFGCPGSA